MTDTEPLPPEPPLLPGARQTLAVRAGHVPSEHGEHSEALFLTSSFRFNSAEQAAARFAETEAGNLYSRFTNPTVRLFERRLASLEGAEDGLATATGMAAILACVLALCQAGSKVVASRQLFGATLTLFSRIVTKFGVEVVLVETGDPAAWAAAAAGRADLFFFETPTNPQLEVYDIAAIAEVAHAAGALVVVDNCVCTPFLQRPLEHGADLVMHSATKYIDGQGRVLGGALCGAREIVHERIKPYLRCGGPSLSPFNAWVLAKGLETLGLRVRAMSATAAGLVELVAGHPAVAGISYPHHAGHPQHGLALRQQEAGGGLVGIRLAGGQPAAFRFLNALQVFSLTANFGDAKSTATHPATTTHARLTPEAQASCGIAPGLVRLSAGLEDPVDLHADLERALVAAGS